MDDLHEWLQELEQIREQKRELNDREKLLKTLLLSEMRARGLKRISLGAERLCAKLQLKLNLANDKGDEDDGK